MASISPTILSTTAGVESVFNSKNNSVNAAFGVFSCISSINSFSACIVSFAILCGSGGGLATLHEGRKLTSLTVVALEQLGAEKSKLDKTTQLVTNQ